MKIEQYGDLDSELVEWNNRMYHKHPTPYDGIAGVIESARVRRVLEFAAIRPTDAVLEIGCECGKLLINSPSAKRVVGADISQDALEDAAKLFESQGRSAEFFQLDAQKPLPFSQGEFNVIICSETLEHVNDPRIALENIHNISTIDTRIIISVPIEAPKVFIKKILRSIGLLKVFFPGIEEDQSEWHLQAFSKRMFFNMVNDLFRVKKHKTVLATHYVALLART